MLRKWRSPILQLASACGSGVIDFLCAVIPHRSFAVTSADSWLSSGNEPCGVKKPDARPIVVIVVPSVVEPSIESSARQVVNGRKNWLLRSWNIVDNPLSHLQRRARVIRIEQKCSVGQNLLVGDLAAALIGSSRQKPRTRNSVALCVTRPCAQR